MISDTALYLALFLMVSRLGGMHLVSFDQTALATPQLITLAPKSQTANHLTHG